MGSKVHGVARRTAPGCVGRRRRLPLPALLQRRQRDRERSNARCAPAPGQSSSGIALFAVSCDPHPRRAGPQPLPPRDLPPALPRHEETPPVNQRRALFASPEASGSPSRTRTGPGWLTGRTAALDLGGPPAVGGVAVGKTSVLGGPPAASPSSIRPAGAGQGNLGGGHSTQAVRTGPRALGLSGPRGWGGAPTQGPLRHPRQGIWSPYGPQTRDAK